MRYEDERYCRLYTRDTPGWLMMPWQARALLPLLMRKLDRAGILDLAEYQGEEMPVALAVVTGLPVEVVEPGLAALLKRKTFVLQGQYLTMPNYIDAQECSQSDKLRKSEQRSRFRDKALAAELGLVTERDQHHERMDERSQSVTESHTRSHAVTVGHSVPSRAVPSLAKPEEAAAASAGIEDRVMAALSQQVEFAAVTSRPLAKAIVEKFKTMQVANGTKEEWLMTSLFECAEDCTNLGLNREALTKKIMGYVKHSKAPRETMAAKNARMTQEASLHDGRIQPVSQVLRVSEVIPSEEEQARDPEAAAKARRILGDLKLIGNGGMR